MVCVLEEPADIRRVSFAQQEVTFLEEEDNVNRGSLVLTDEDIANYFWGDRECMESRLQRRALVNVFKRHMRERPEIIWTEEKDSV